MIKIKDVVKGSIHMNKYGSAYLVSDNLKKDIYINKKNTNRALHLDNVKVEIIEGLERPIEGRVIKITKRFKTKFVGTIEISNNFAFLVPDSQKMPVDIYIPLNKLKGATNGQKVIGKITKWEEGKKTPNGKIVEVLGDVKDSDVQINAIMCEYDLPTEFTEDVQDEVAKLISKPIPETNTRRDMRDAITFTIDPETAKDFDDALSVTPCEGGYEIGIHIADVSHYVRPGTELDKEAYNRGTSIYLVDRVIPMLPEALSNGVCSLSPHEDKLCFSAVFKLTLEGQMFDEWFGRTIIHSDHRFTYGEAEQFIQNEVLFHTPKHNESTTSESYQKINLCIHAVRELNKIAKRLRAKRTSNGSITFEKEEVNFIFEDNKPVDVILAKSGDSNKLIEEFMLLANTRVAKFLKGHKIPTVNRIHDEPNIDKLETLNDYIKQFGYSLNLFDIDTLRESINQLLIDIKDTDEENIINNLLVRSMQKAVYSTNDVGHFGLSFEDYTHFTSPIRRYPDILVHRILDRVLKGKTPQKEVKLMNKCQYLSNMEVRAQRASRDSIKYKQCEFMETKIGRVYTGIVNGVTNQGLYVNIIGTNCEGFISLSSITTDSFTTDLDTFSVKSENTGGTIRLGDEIWVTIKTVDLIRRTIYLSMLNLK